MDNFNVIVTVHKISEDGDVSAIRVEENYLTGLVTVTKLPYENGTDISGRRWDYVEKSNKLKLVFPRVDLEEVATVTLVEIRDTEEVNSVDYAVQPKSKIPSVPSMIRCQNCDTNFATKYKYQRHNCDFIGDKTVMTVVPDVKRSEKSTKFCCGICDKKFVNQRNLDIHESNHTEREKHVCEHCNNKFVSASRLIIHQASNCKKTAALSKFHHTDVTAWKCITCGQVFGTSTSADMHAEMCTEVPGGNVVPHVIASSEVILQCRYCNTTYLDSKSLLKHQYKHTTQVNFECVSCKETFSLYTTAVNHWMTVCSDETNSFSLKKMTYCEVCEETFTSHEELYTHKIKRRHYSRKMHVVLNEDTDMFLDTRNEKEHTWKEKFAEVFNQNFMATETKATPKSLNQVNGGLEEKKTYPTQKLQEQLSHFVYQCERCDGVFNTILDLELHRKKDHTDNCLCEMCGQVLQNVKALEIHRRGHKNLKPYPCDFCDKAFSQSSHLLQHIRYHKGIKPFICHYEGCDARFTIGSDLRDHICTRHTRERKFKCATCNKSFLTGTVYYQHRLMHTSDRRYSCEICKKKFFRANGLRTHLLIHNKEKPYPCEFCERNFRRNGDRKKHLQSQHPNQL